MTIKEVKDIIKDCSDDMPVFLQGFTDIQIDILEISDRHSEKWNQPKKFVMIFKKGCPL